MAKETDMQGSTKKLKMRKPSLKALVLLVVLVGALTGIGVLANKYAQAQDEVKRLSNPQEATKSEAEKLKGVVGQLVELPADETPTVATVVDANKLREQAFFAKAENGDKVLIFTKSKRAILYRPSINKIIEVAPVNLGDNQQQQPTQ